MQIFYSNNINSGVALITDQEHVHLSKVLRKSVADTICVCDGQGTLYEGEIVSQNKKESVVQLRFVVQQQIESNNRLSIAIAPTKNADRIEWFLEKAIEIGMQKVYFFHSKHSERRILKLDRLHSIALSAMKQSKSLFLPEIVSFTNFNEVLNIVDAEFRYIAYVEEGTTFLKSELKNVSANDSVCVFIGPEGGFTQEEILAANQIGIKSVSLGAKRLRTETAGLYSVMSYNLICQ